MSQTQTGTTMSRLTLEITDENEKEKRVIK